ncbi:MAG: hypothetical protein ACI90V_014258, partial [Bacillariaceae sp.]
MIMSTITTTTTNSKNNIFLLLSIAVLSGAFGPSHRTPSQQKQKQLKSSRNFQQQNQKRRIGSYLFSTTLEEGSTVVVCT